MGLRVAACGVSTAASETSASTVTVAAQLDGVWAQPAGTSQTSGGDDGGSGAIAGPASSAMVRLNVADAIQLLRPLGVYPTGRLCGRGSLMVAEVTLA